MKNEADTKHATFISETAFDAIYNPIVRIETQKLSGTGFILKKEIQNEFKYFLITCEHIITKDDVNSKISIELYYGKKINEKKKIIVLDNSKRFITCFRGEKDVTVIEILKSDDIPEDKYLIADLNYKYGYNIYKNGKIFLAGYPNDPMYQNERYISSGEIKSIKGFEFEHSIDTRPGSYGAPICLIENLRLIGIHKQGNKIKAINRGTFIGVILNELVKIYIEKDNTSDNKGKLNNKINNQINNNNSYTNDFNIELKNPIHKLNYHTDWVYCLTVMNDGRLVSGSGDHSIIIYNKETYKPDLIIKEHNDTVYYIIQLSSGNLASCSADNSIKLFNIKGNKYEVLQSLNYHTTTVYQIIELKNKALVSCSYAYSIIFYIKDNLKYKKDYQISINGVCDNIIQTKDNEICYYECNNQTICFYDLLERKVKASISNIYTCRMIMIKKDLLLITGCCKISIININNYKLRIIDVPGVNFIYGVCMLNQNMLLTGDNASFIRQWRIEGDNLILISKKENAHDGHINLLLNLGNGHIASCSHNTIIIW